MQVLSYRTLAAGLGLGQGYRFSRVVADWQRIAVRRRSGAPMTSGAQLSIGANRQNLALRQQSPIGDPFLVKGAFAAHSNLMFAALINALVAFHSRSRNAINSA